MGRPSHGPPSKDICTVQGRPFVKLSPCSYTLAGMVRAQYTAEPGNSKSSYKSIRDNLSLPSVLKARNDAQRKAEGSPECTLLGSEEITIASICDAEENMTKYVGGGDWYRTHTG